MYAIKIHNHKVDPIRRWRNGWLYWDDNFKRASSGDVVTPLMFAMRADAEAYLKAVIDLSKNPNIAWQTYQLVPCED
jgi:hypothetical protein